MSFLDDLFGKMENTYKGNKKAKPSTHASQTARAAQDAARRMRQEAKRIEQEKFDKYRQQCQVGCCKSVVIVRG